MLVPCFFVAWQSNNNDNKIYTYVLYSMKYIFFLTMVRVKRRYIVFRMISKKKQDVPSDHDFLAELTNHVAQTYGDFGVGCLKRGFSIKKHDNYNGYVILQVRKGVHEMVMSVMPLITKVGNVSCHLNIIHLSGTIRGSLKYLRRDYIMNLRASIGATKDETLLNYKHSGTKPSS